MAPKKELNEFISQEKKKAFLFFPLSFVKAVPRLERRRKINSRL